jgi:hypothetical protein
VGVRVRLPFGKWRTFEIEDVPVEYLRWLLKKADLREPLRGAVAYEVDRRRWERRQIAKAIDERFPGQSRKDARTENLEVRS